MYPLRIVYQGQVYLLREAHSSEPVQRAHDRIRSLIERGKSPHEGTLRRLQSTTNPAKVHGIIQAAQQLATREKSHSSQRLWQHVAEEGKRRHQELTGVKYKEHRYETPEKVTPATKKLPTEVSAKPPKAPKPSRTVQDDDGDDHSEMSSGGSKWVRVIRKRDGKIVQVRRGKETNKAKYKALKKAAELQV